MNILTFDIEDWFHILDNSSTKGENEWGNFDTRIHENMERIISFLVDNNQPATFFCLGWIAEKYPQLIKEIVELGYEIGSHSYLHQLVYEQTPKILQADTERSVKTLEDVTGQKVKYFRAPGFSITEDVKWAFEVLIELGIIADSSVFPVSRAHGGFPSYGHAEPSILSIGGEKLMEFPINTYRYFGKEIVFSGGGFFRLQPYRLIQHCTNRSNYIMSYFHPRDFDSQQPRIKGLSYFRHFKTYIGLKHSFKKFEKWINENSFIDIGKAVELTDWERTPCVFI